MIGSALVHHPQHEQCGLFALSHADLDWRRQVCRRQRSSHFIALIPSGVSGPGDSFDLAAGYVVSATILKVEAAKRTKGAVSIWRTGKPVREFLFVDAAAAAIMFLTHHFDDAEPINIGPDIETSIRELVEETDAMVGFDGTFAYDISKPDGMPRKQLGSDRILAMDWRTKTPRSERLRRTVDWYQAKRR